MQNSQRMLVEARQFLAGGVGSSPRLWEGDPLFVTSGNGVEVTDVDGRTYVDLLMAYGALILGHRPAAWLEEVTAALQRGAMFGLGHQLEAEAARLVVERIPSMDLVCFTNTGSEADMSAVRLARAYTGRPLILKFEGHYHGWSDSLNWSTRVKPDRLAPQPETVPSVAGLPAGIGQTIITCTWNDIDAVRAVVAQHGDQIAAVITEPWMANTGCIEPQPGFLAQLRELCTAHGIVLIFDEVVTGFRVARGGAQEVLGVRPDLTVLGKALGSGVPVAAYGGRREIMEVIVDGRLPHQGTYNTNPLAMAAVKATMTALDQPDTYPHLYRVGTRLRDGMVEALGEMGFPVFAQGPGPIFALWFSEQPVRNYRDAVSPLVRQDLFVKFQRAMLAKGVLMRRDPFGFLCVGTAFTDALVDRTLEAAWSVAREMGEARDRGAETRV